MTREQQLKFCKKYRINEKIRTTFCSIWSKWKSKKKNYYLNLTLLDKFKIYFYFIKKMKTLKEYWPLIVILALVFLLLYPFKCIQPQCITTPCPEQCWNIFGMFLG